MLTVSKYIAYEIEILVFFMLRTIIPALFHLETAMLTFSRCAGEQEVELMQVALRVCVSHPKAR